MKLLNGYLNLCADVGMAIGYLAVALYALCRALKQQFDDFTGRRPINRTKPPQPKALPPGRSKAVAQPPLALRSTEPNGISRYSPMNKAELEACRVSALRSMARTHRRDLGDQWPLATPIHKASKRELLTTLLPLLGL